MSDWALLNRCRVRSGRFASNPDDGFNGMFLMQMLNRPLRVIASDGAGWKHVSVSIEGSEQTPSWEIMCRVKDLFYEPEDCVMQLHPPKSDYVNCHPGCLHLWQPTDCEIPRPKAILVGPKG